MKQTIKCFFAVFAAMLLSVAAYAQVTTSALAGRAVDVNGEPIVGVAVIATHTPSGTVYGVTTNEAGRYTINGMRSGGPYKVEFSCLGYQTVAYTDFTLQLAETSALNATLNEDSEMLSEAMVIAAAASKFSAEKTGAATNISQEQMMALPTVSRNIEDLTKLSPYGGNGMNFAGSDGRSSNFTVDGANFNNNFGLNDGLPGGGNPISIDAIEEMQVVVSPYDVRQSNFIGGGVNAITKSGTNTFKGSAYVYHKNENMRGNRVDGEELGDRGTDRKTIYGVTLGGPIVKDKLFFFVNFEYAKIPTIVNRWRASVDGVGSETNYLSRTTVADMEKVKNHLWNKYKYDTGSYTDFPANESNIKALARIDWNINKDHHLSLRYNFTKNIRYSTPSANSSDAATRHPYSEPRMSMYSMSFANSMYSQNNNVNSFTVDLNSRFTENLSNQFLVTFSKLDDVRGSESDVFPFIDILNGYEVKDGKIHQQISPYISAGYELYTLHNAVHNTVVTVKDDVTYYTGDHKITAGLNYEYQMADNIYLRSGNGYYRYRSLDDFLNEAAPESVVFTYGYNGVEAPAVRVRYSQVGAYAQEEWTPNDRFKLTAGLRFDMMFFDNQDIMRNNAIYELDYAGKHVDTGVWPSPKLQVSPRIGFTWDVLGNKSLKVRGGTGLFAGRLPLVYFTNMPSNSGMIQKQVVFTTKYQDGVASEIDPNLQHFAGPIVADRNALFEKLNQLDPNAYPAEISPEDGTLQGAIQAVEKDFKMPQIWKTSLGVDYFFPTSFPMSLSGEFIFNKTVNGVLIENWNIKDCAGYYNYNGADNRPIYASDYKMTKTDAYMLTNTNKGYGYTANVLFNITPISSLNIAASYTYTASKELSGMPGNNAASIFQAIPNVYGAGFLTLHNSQYVTPHRAFVNLTYSDKGNNHYSLFYETYQAGRYSYIYDGDFNNDSVANDLMYIPKDDTEIRFASESDRERYWAFAKNDKYLSAHKGQYAEAYSVYSPWTHRLDFSYKHDFKVKAGKSMNTLQLSVDIKNILNLFNSSWGVTKIMNTDLNEGKILALDHVDADGVPVFKTNAKIQPGMPLWQYSHAIGQCWYAQVGIKYMFN